MSEASVTNVPVPMVPVEVIVREPFDTLYHREFAGLVRLAMVLVDSQEQAEEVVQDAFAALYLKYRLVSTPLPYVRASVLNGSRKVLRRRMLARRLPSEPQPDGALVYNHVIDAVRRLPARQRAAVVLRYELQLTDAEIAETLKVPIGTVKSTLHRAIVRLREEVTE
ncbi:MAG: sigma-70 family RNA polymerase sigma factor [Ilumatobacteraceae bacterium]|nr:sigma-70 family RNA polymerase sigma factor [Ilumatobacteraceae bacterium]